ncbi:aldo/keto reductase [Spongiimicrobium salis]|uniref:aldo/keto reductase n=1 Tax=Spongiimicrobium salis TaxID=1667022 RepID=UPI00374DC036
MKNKTTYSRIIAGTMTWGSWGKQLPKKEMIGLMNHCLDLDISTFDHADIYGGYTTEADFGAAFADSGIARENVQLISKCGIQFVCENRPKKLQHYQYDKKYIIASVEQSLKNLHTDYLDFLLLHRPSPLLDPQEVVEAIAQLREQGKIVDFGVSNFTPSQIAVLETAIPVQGNQVEFSLPVHGAMNDGSLEDCMVHERLAMAWSPLGGFFKAEGEQAEKIRKVIAPMTEKYNASIDQLLLTWLLRHPAKIHPVVGTATPERLADSIKALDIQMELEDWFELLVASQGHPMA